MKPNLFRELVAVLLCGLLLLQSATAAAPGWWSTRGVRNVQKTADDYAVANVGQLKNIAKKAAQEMNDVLPGGAGAQINALIAAWEAPPVAGAARDDYAALNLGQLKSVAKLFHDRLAAAGAGAAGMYPWGGGGHAPDDFAAANLGQLKAAFAFDIISVDADNDGMPDAWEMMLFASLAQGAQDDFDGDGVSNLAEQQAGTRPDSNDTDGDGFSDKVERDNGFDPKNSTDNPDAAAGSDIGMMYTTGNGNAWASCAQEWPYDKTPPTYGKGWSWNLDGQQDNHQESGKTSPQALPELHDISTPGNFPQADAYWEWFPRIEDFEESSSPWRDQANSEMIAAAYARHFKGSNWEEAESMTSFGALRLHSQYPRLQATTKTVLLTRETYAVSNEYGNVTQLISTNDEVITLELPAGATIGTPKVISAEATMGQMEIVRATLLPVEIEVPDLPEETDTSPIVDDIVDYGIAAEASSAPTPSGTNVYSFTGLAPPHSYKTADKPLQVAKFENSTPEHLVLANEKIVPHRDPKHFRVAIRGMSANQKISIEIETRNPDDTVCDDATTEVDPEIRARV